MQEMVAMSLHMLGSGDGLQSIGDLYVDHKNTLSRIVRELLGTICDLFLYKLRVVS